ncbi:unnamed protein product [Owenia fusiformis]|uniref:Uncharacterized protein n=1 Tax=Owenia fusiformis TaxID=6347 RepID=A0A8J1XSP1_OWEFU|nr:unnamed protein product [Owenia fusiformis]
MKAEITNSLLLLITISMLFLATLAGDYKRVFGRYGYTECISGDLNVIIIIPHGGRLKPPDIPDRHNGCDYDKDKNECRWSHNCSVEKRDPENCAPVLSSDALTIDLAKRVANDLKVFLGKRPHVIISHLHRSKMDANRAIEEAAFNNTYAKAAWEDFHDYIGHAKASIHGRGILFDFHGQSHPEGWVELGYLYRHDILDAGNLNPNSSSIRSLAQYADVSFEELIRGKTSFGGILQEFSYKTIPSPNFPSPKGRKYYRGGYNTRRHGSRYGGLIDAIQIETPMILRHRETISRYAEDLARTIKKYLEIHYATKTTPKPMDFITVKMDLNSTNEVIADIVQASHSKASTSCLESSAYITFLGPTFTLSLYMHVFIVHSV